MASQQAKSSQQFNPYLSPNQQDLLLAALNSQATKKTRAKAAIGDTGITNHPTSTSHISQPKANKMSATAVFQSPGNMDSYNPDFTPDLDYLDGDASFDFDNADLGGEMIGGLPGLDADGKPEQHDKRKNTDDDDGSPDEGSAKRQELGEGEKGAKKPGRKPLTNEPTTKRKAQNRAAQRAFRDRKEKHLKDLETRVLELAKAREADQHENGLLKAQVDRLQVELKDYRKRLSLNGSTGRGSPPSNQSKSGSGSVNGQNNFQFDFPKFGALPGSQIFPNAPQNGSADNSQRGSPTPPVKNQSPGANVSYNTLAQQPALNRANSSGKSLSPGSLQSNESNSGSPANSSNNFSTNNSTSNYNFAPYSTNDNMHGFATTLPQMGDGGSDPFGDLFSPSILKTVGHTGNGYFNPIQQNTNAPAATVNNGGDSTAGIPDNRVFRFNSTSNTSDSASPSASSLSQWNLNGTTNSSCGTSPEPSHESPLNKDKPNETYDKTNLQNSYTPNTTSNVTSSNNNAFMANQYSNNNNFSAFDMSNSNPAFNMPQLDSFDPVLFGDYRDNSHDIFGGADFAGDFFNEALNTSAPIDYSSPSNLFGILQNLPQPTPQPSTAPAPSRNLMAEMDKTRDGGDDDYGLPSTNLQQQAATPQPRQQSTAMKKDSAGNLISCNNLWTQLQTNRDFQDGKFDLDGLCSELRAKARCSESGVMVDQDHVDKALRKLGKTAAENAKDNLGPPEAEGQAHLMFEQSSWENVLAKMSGNNGNGGART